MESTVSDRENVQDLSTQITDLRIVDDFLWVDYALPETVCTDNSNRIVTNITQYEANCVNNRVELSQPEYNEDGNSKLALDEEVIIEQQYWDQSGNIIDKVKGKPKLQTSQRKSVRDCNIIDNNKTIPRHPSYYKFDDDVTTRLLDTYLLKNTLYKNIVAKGHNSVVIYAEIPKRITTSFILHYGHAVKVYKLGSDVKQNCAILKRVEKEVENLECIKNSVKFYKFKGNIPVCVHRVRNIIVMNFFGYDQETAPSVENVPDEICQQIYQNTVNEMDFWYHTAEIVHGRLSTKNIVYYRGTPCYLGWSRAVRRWHPQALTKLMKDCHFVTNYFESRGVAVKPRDELFKEITGRDKISIKLLDVPHKKDLWKHRHLTNPNRSWENNVLSSGRCRFKC